MTSGGKRAKRSWVVRFIVRPLLILFALTILWVLLYRFVPGPFTVPMAKDFFAGKDVKRDWTSFSNIDPDLPRAVIAGEDGKFCSHFGFDTEAISKAMEANADGRKLRGGSTVSQQVAKNAFLWPGRSWLRKGLEAYFTVERALQCCLDREGPHELADRVRVPGSEGERLRLLEVLYEDGE